MHQLKKFCLSLIMTLLFAGSLTAQSISFTPNNGATITGSGSETTVNAYLYFSSTLSSPSDRVAEAYAKLTTDQGTYYANIKGTDLGNFPQLLSVAPGSHSWTIEQYEKWVGEPNFFVRASSTNSLL